MPVIDAFAGRTVVAPAVPVADRRPAAITPGWSPARLAYWFYAVAAAGSRLFTRVNATGFMWLRPARVCGDCRYRLVACAAGF